MTYIKCENKEEITLFPASIKEYICEDSYVSVIYTFVEKLDLESIGAHAPDRLK